MVAEEPTNAQILDAIGLDGRVRSVEIRQATFEAKADALERKVDAMETRILAAIEASKPRPVWPAVSAIASALAVLVVIMAAIYGQR